MKSERLDRLIQDGVAFDLETPLIQPGLVAPPIVCGSLALVNEHGMQGELLDAHETALNFTHIATDERRTLIGAAIHFDVICELVAGASATDVFAMYDRARSVVKGIVDGRVIDVQIFEKLHAIAKGWLGIDPFTLKKITDPDTHKPGRYSLREVVKQVLGRDNAKANDRYRKSYALLANIPIKDWPSEARAYPIDDAINTLESGLAQAGHVENVGPHDWQKIARYPWLGCAHCGADFNAAASVDCHSKYRRLNAHLVSRETYFAFCLNLGAAWGYHVNQDSVDALESKYIAEHEGKLQPFIDAGIIRPDGTQDESATKKLVARAYGACTSCPTCFGTGKAPSPKTEGRTKVNCKDCNGTALLLPATVPRSEANQVSIGRDALNESGDEFLISFADYDEGKKTVTVYIPYLRNRDKDKVEHPHVHRVLRPNNPLETLRVSYDGATMLLPRHGGVRECHEARPGMVYSSEDYKAGELVTHAQDCLEICHGSRLAEALIAGLDAHLALAAQIIGIPYELAKQLKKAADANVTDTRQVCKPPNFGFPGRMGAAALTRQQRKQNDVHTPHPYGPQLIPDGRGNMVRGFKGLRFCIMMKRADRCGEVKVPEWKGRPLNGNFCKKCIECCEDLKLQWLTQWPENVPYFAHVKIQQDRAEAGFPVEMPVSGFLRGFKTGQVDEDGQPINYGNAIANGYFQHRLAFAAGNAYMAATRECYDRTCRVESYTWKTSVFEGGESPLYGSRLPQFHHDEIIGEHYEDTAHEASLRISELMEESLRLVCPDMGKPGSKAIEANPTLMRKLTKSAEPVYVNGRLVPWEPQHEHLQ